MSNWNPQANDIFIQALDLSNPTDLPGFLRQACQGNFSLLEVVQGLLKAHGEAGSFLEHPADILATLDDDRVKPQSCREKLGSFFGPYQLLEQIGEGGFGRVFLAEQQYPVRRMVALKILKPGMDSQQIINRFEAERQALAIMDHPNIARVFDAGTTETGRPYFAMEWVNGLPLTQYCDENKLQLKERLQLFMEVCQAVQHAHQKGVIHRDIKPSNVLVALQDGKVAIKVIDFGIAKAIHGQLTDHTINTGFAQCIGTPLYMSPEQAGLSSLDVDTRSDIYSLGVLLYELITGTTPFSKERLSKISYDELRRIIREEEPPRPSTRISTLGQLVSTITEHRKSNPRRLSRQLRGEMDWIVMKALEKDRNHRYESANSFALDVQRFLANEPVLACPPSAWYRIRKFVRRNKGKVVAATALVGVLLAGIVGTSLALLKAEINRDKAEKNFQLAEDNFRLALTGVDRYFTKVSEDPKLVGRGMEGLRRDLLLTARDFYQEFTEKRHHDPNLQEDLGRAYFRLGYITSVQGSKEEALGLYLKARDILTRVGDKARNVADLQSDLAALHNALGLIYDATSKPQEAEDAFLRAYFLGAALAEKYPSVPKFQNAMAMSSSNLAAMYQDAGRFSEAEKTFHKARLILEKLTQEAPEEVMAFRGLGILYHNEATIFRDTGRIPLAESTYKKAILVQDKLVKMFWDDPNAHNDLATTYHSLGIAFQTNKQLTEAEKSFRKAYEIRHWIVDRHAAIPEFQYDLASSLANLGTIYQMSDRLVDAEKSFDQVKVLYKKLAAEHPQVWAYQKAEGTVLANLGSIYKETRRFSKAQAAYEEARKRFEDLHKSRPEIMEIAAGLAMVDMNMANLKLEQGKNQEALPYYGKAITRFEEILQKEGRQGRQRYNLGLAYWNRSQCLLQLNQPRKALADRDRAIELDDTKNPSNLVARIATLVVLDEHQKALASIDDFSPKNDAEALYDLAALCSASTENTTGKIRDQYAQRAGQMLKKSLAVGLKNKARVVDDPRFGPVRNRPDFQLILQSVGHPGQTPGQFPPGSPASPKVFTGTLAPTDPRDQFPLTAKCPHKAHLVRLEAGQPYLIDLKGSFDTFLRVVDQNNNSLVYNDNIWPGNKNSRLVFLPPNTGDYRLVVTSGQEEETGSYTLKVEKTSPLQGPQVISGKLTIKDPQDDQGKYFQFHKVKLAAGQPYTVELASKEFDTLLAVLGNEGKQVISLNDDISPDNQSKARIDITPKKDGEFTLVVTSYSPETTGTFTLTLTSYRAITAKKGPGLKNP